MKRKKTDISILPSFQDLFMLGKHISDQNHDCSTISTSNELNQSLIGEDLTSYLKKLKTEETEKKLQINRNGNFFKLQPNESSFPNHILLYIFQFLSTQDLLRAGLVCKKWLQLSNQAFLGFNSPDWSSLHQMIVFGRNSAKRAFTITKILLDDSQIHIPSKDGLAKTAETALRFPDGFAFLFLSSQKLESLFNFFFRFGHKFPLRFNFLDSIFLKILGNSKISDASKIYEELQKMSSGSLVDFSHTVVPESLATIFYRYEVLSHNPMSLFYFCLDFLLLNSKNGCHLLPEIFASSLVENFGNNIILARNVIECFLVLDHNCGIFDRHLKCLVEDILGELNFLILNEKFTELKNNNKIQKHSLQFVQELIIELNNRKGNPIVHLERINRILPEIEKVDQYLGNSRRYGSNRGRRRTTRILRLERVPQLMQNFNWDSMFKERKSEFDFTFDFESLDFWDLDLFPDSL